MPEDVRWRFNPPPGWPPAPPGWVPPEGWRPDPSWPPPPEGWQWWLPADGERDTQPGRDAQPAPALGGDDPASRTLWEGHSHTVAAAATGGRAGGRYRLTPTTLYFEEGIVTTDAEQVPVRDIIDVDLHQSITQKARGTGDVLVHVAGELGPARVVTLESVEDPAQVRDIVNLAARDARLRVEARENTVHYDGTPPGAAQAPAAEQPAPPGVLDQLRKLGELREAGVVSEAEFAAKKAELLGRL